MPKQFSETRRAKSATDTERLIRLDEVKSRTGRCRSSIYADIKSGDFPPNISIGPRAVAWTESSISDWIAARITAARGGQS